MRIPNVSQRKDSANSERIQQFCTCKKRNLLCCAIGCQCRRRLCYRGSNDPKKADAGNRQKQVLFARVSPQSLRVRLVRWVVGITCWLEKSLNRELDASGGQLAVSHSLKSRGWRLLALFVRTRLVLPSN